MKAVLHKLIASATARARNGKVDEEEVLSLLNAAETIIEAKGKCPESGCVVKRGGKWRVISNRTGKLWPAEYNTKKDADDALAAYHLRKQGVPPKK